MKTLQERGAYLDLRNKRLIMPESEGDVQISVSKKAKVYQLIQAPGGYFMLPCTPGTETLVKPRDYKYHNNDKQ